MQRELDKLVGENKLTIPIVITPFIEKCCSDISDEYPIFIDVTPEAWSRQSTCERNVEEYIRIHQGTKVFGYKFGITIPTILKLKDM